MGKRGVKKILSMPFFAVRWLCIRAILFYQRRLSKHTCLYRPSCSEYTKRSIHNLGAVAGIFCGIGRILRCNPLSKGGFDPAPERFSSLRWLI